jgi:glycyl-tRNA synthetase beta chain
MSLKPFVFEIGVEEIPSRYLNMVTDEFGIRLQQALETARILEGRIAVASTPRRLVAWGSVRARQSPQTATVRGPRLEASYRDGKATPALEGFLQRTGVALEDVGQETIDQKTYLVVYRAEPEDEAESVLPDAVQSAVLAMDLPRTMRWGDGEMRFVRPLRWLGLWLGESVLEVAIGPLTSGAVTYGNRTDHPEPLEVGSATAYARLLEQPLKVMLDGQKRRDVIRREGEVLAAAVGGVVDDDAALLAEVSALVEWPMPFCGTFDSEFLSIPEPVLTTAMKVHQRYFPVRHRDGGLLPYFIGVRNGEGQDLDGVRHGNEKVLRARLKDADYFYQQDLSRPLESHLERLDAVVFHAKLGSYGDKMRRLASLWQRLAPHWASVNHLAEDVERAIVLAKCDLLTHVVEEFPELEGVMGGIYARKNGESPRVAEALAEQYLPRLKGDPIPQNPVGIVLGLLDRMDTLVMAWAHEIRPTGSEDPFGLRRSALAVARIWTESQQGPVMGLRALIEATNAVYGLDIADSSGLWDLIVGRLKSFWSEVGLVDGLDAVLAVNDDLNDLIERWEKVQELIKTPVWPSYVAAFKRVDRVLGPEASSLSSQEGFSPKEAALVEVTGRLQAAALAGVEQWWSAVPEMVQALEAYFEQVLVMDPDLTVRARRLGVLAQVRQALSIFWDATLL